MRLSRNVSRPQCTFVSIDVCISVSVCVCLCVLVCLCLLWYRLFGQDEECDLPFVLGSDDSLPLRFRSTETGEGWDGGVCVYVDERMVGVAQGGNFILTGVGAGWHSLQIVACHPNASEHVWATPIYRLFASVLHVVSSACFTWRRVFVNSY
jgi:hypothetical protein